MTQDSNDLIVKFQEFENKQQYDEILSIITDDFLDKEKDEPYIIDLYIWRGNTWYNIKEYDKAIADYEKVLVLDNNSALALYNRGFAWIAKKEYDKAIEDYDKVISLYPNDYAVVFLNRAAIRRINKEYEKAIEDYNEAIRIDPNYANAYYNRGLSEKEKNGDLEKSKNDFEQYLMLTKGENDKWTKYANYYIEELEERIIDKDLNDIVNIVFDIRGKLLIKNGSITHYSSLSAVKSLLMDKSKFRLSEGNLMNDPSEGTELLKYLDCEFPPSDKNYSDSEIYFPKPFIGSFVTNDKNDDLNMWRFYGKENGTEARGCAITLKLIDFINDIRNSLAKNEEDILKHKSDINFYRVAYIEKDTQKFFIPNLLEETTEINELIIKLKDKVCKYSGENINSLEKYLNTIVFLFKRDDYKNENEVRLVVQGVEFEKKYNMDVSPPKVYIELESIDNIIEQVTLGPKVEKASEWATAFHYCFEGKKPKIVLSHLPFK
jgi:tetratricopeptide (TPR) repeat protein